MKQNPVYTLGHGRRQADEFMILLKELGIDYLVDIRSNPYSRFNPQFNREYLESSLAQNQIRYVFMGDSLGGRPADPSCYDANGCVDYGKLEKKPDYVKGINRVKKAFELNEKLALMCSESKPSECHRYKLVAQTLTAAGVTVMHIDESRLLQTQEEVRQAVKKANKTPDLFRKDEV